MPSIKHLEAQIRSLTADQKSLIDDESRPWAAKRSEFDKRDGDIKSLLEQYQAMKSVGGDPFAAGASGLDPVRTLKGIQAGIVAQGYEPILAPQLDLSADDTKALYEAAISHKSFAVTAKATTTSSVPQSTITDYKLTPVPMRREPTRVLSLVPTYGTTAPSVTWYSTTGTAAAAAVAEGGTKPTSSIAYTANTTAVTKLAHVAEVTDETLADFPAFLGVLQQDMVDGVIKVENDELLNATVTGAHNFPGLLNTTGILVGTAVPASPTQNDRLDAIGAAIDGLRVGSSFADPDGIVMHPTTWGVIKRSKSDQNEYLLGDPGSNADPNLWGVPVVITTQIATGTVLIGDFANSTAAYVREGIRVDTGGGEAQFKNNTTLVRAEERLLLTVPRPTGLIRVTGF